MTGQKLQWGKALASFALVLLLMPLGHASMILMEHFLPENALHYCAFALGGVGLALAIWGIFVKGDFKQTILGLTGGLLLWTGWVEFIFQYFARRFNVPAEIVDGVVVTKPEYLMLAATFGVYMIIMVYYIFSTRVGCNYIVWWQKLLMGKRRDSIVPRAGNRHVSMVTFMEFNMIMWTSYLLLMYLYIFVGDHSPITFAIGAACFVGSIYIFRKQLRLSSWGANIRMAIPTVIVFWTPVEIAGRIDLFAEIWIEPEKYAGPLWGILSAFVIIGAYIAFKALHKEHASK